MVTALARRVLFSSYAHADFGIVQSCARGRTQQGARTEEIVQQLRRREDRPHPVERLSHHLRVAQPFAHIARSDLVAARTGQCIEYALLDEPSSAVVRARPTASVSDDCRAVVDGQVQGLDAEPDA